MGFTHEVACDKHEAIYTCPTPHSENIIEYALDAEWVLG